MTRVETALREAINSSKTEVEEKQDRSTHDFGETVAAIRQKLHDVELWASNTFMRRDSFYKVQEEIKLDMTKLGDRIDARLLRIETKLDTKT